MIMQVERVEREESIPSMREASDEGVFDIRGNFFCADCGAGYNIVPYLCMKCFRGLWFITVGERWYARELKLQKKLEGLKRASILVVRRDYVEFSDEDEITVKVGL